MTSTERYQEIEVRLHPWEFACYWCGRIYRKNRCTPWRDHINIMHDTKHFCSLECKAEWIDAKSTFGELMP